MDSPSHLSLIPKEVMVTAQTGKFEAKLTFEERCAVLACAVYGVARPVIAAAFSINRRTVTHVVNDNGIHYKDVRKKLKELGKDEFIKEYLTESVAQKIADTAKLMPAPVDSSPGVTPGTVPSVRANRCAGIQVVHPEQCAYSHRLEIQWREATEEYGETGWWYRDLDSSSYDVWLHNGPESLMTSQSCLKAAEANLTDD